MITYADIQKANGTLVFSPIHGKNYAEVPQRVKAFRILYPQGFIITEMLSNENGVCVIKATAGYYAEDGSPLTLGTGMAYEKEGSSNINRTSYIENCETSAVGRALGFLGLGSETSIASYEEVQNAIKQQEDEAPDAFKPGNEVEAPKGKFDALAAACEWAEKHGINMETFGRYRDAVVKAGLADNIHATKMTESQFNALCDAIRQNFGDKLKVTA